MAYKIKPLVDSNYNFADVFADKQIAVRQATGLEFDLASIVTYLQKQTNNFTIENAVAHDLDSAIFDAVQKYQEEVGAPEIEVPNPEQEMQDIREAIELLELLGDDADDESKEALQVLKMLV